MRIVTMNHRDGRGTVDYRIYESPELLLADKPDANITDKLEKALQGDYVISKNGWVVPMLQITELRNKYYKSGFERRERRKEIIYKVYHFPKQRICVKFSKISKYEFNYVPKNTKNMAGNEVVNRMYELTVRKIQWAQLVANGYDPETATLMVYPRVIAKKNLTKSLLLNYKIQDYISQKSGISWNATLEKAGMNMEYFASKIKSIIEDDKENPGIRVWALKLVMDIYMRKRM
jgi:hypothetical protein